MLVLLLMLLPVQLWAAPAIQSWTTEKGARVLFVPAPELPMLDLRVVFDGGSARGAIPGVASLTSALLEEGAGDWDADEIAQRLDSVGAKMSASSQRDMASLTVRTLTEKRALTETMDTVAQVLGAPRFDPLAFERNRKAMLVSLNHDEQSPGTVAQRTFMHTLFGEHPYAAQVEGTQESLARVTREDVITHYKKYYVAKNAVIAIVGAVERAEAEHLAELVSSGLQPGERAPELPQVSDLQASRTLVLPFPSSQSHILMGQPGMQRGDPDYFVLYVGNHILGGSGLVSQLSDEVREKRGLSYSVYSYFSPMRRNGPFLIGAQTQNAKAAETLEVIRQTLARFIEQGPGETELTAAKQNITGGFPLRIASNSKILEYIAMLGFYDLPLDYLDTFVDNINSVTSEQIRDAFQRRIKPDQLLTVVVGNEQTPAPAN
ncbi:M16 family metallopeptidase [Sedimenticola hydrogenitrophicus]|uniref:M16 family metallopeptidase n=1 Tax=Sedimenticola hydrogenitrophicus TaxID=2967975 RepID=UPI0021A39365|nr:pitrilysin family protein [Sedimenticola hydrogenitrophicus]